LSVYLYLVIASNLILPPSRAPLDQLVIRAQEQDQEDLAQLDPRDSRDQREHLANQEPLDQLDLMDNR